VADLNAAKDKVTKERDELLAQVTLLKKDQGTTSSNIKKQMNEEYENLLKYS
jgi:hypothetical protein